MVARCEKGRYWRGALDYGQTQGVCARLMLAR